MNKDIFELYSDFLLSSFNQTTATNLSRLTDGNISHDQVTRFLSGEELSSKQLWKQVKPTVRKHEQDDGVLIVDDTVQEKKHTDENDINCWHFDHTVGRSVKGINILNCVYHAGEACIPVAYEIINKSIQYTDLKDKKIKRKSEVTKNNLMRTMLRNCKQNDLKFKYVLADIWFSSSENMTYVKYKLKKDFLFAMKSNRLVALSEDDKLKGKFINIKNVEFPKQQPLMVWVKGIDFPILLHKQVFINKDDSTGILYLACSDLSCDKGTLETIYKKRWKVEVYHRTLKQNGNLAKSPARRKRTQSNHIFMSIYATFKLECLSIKTSLTHYALRMKMLINATKSAYDQLNTMKGA